MLTRANAGRKHGTMLDFTSKSLSPVILGHAIQIRTDTGIEEVIIIMIEIEAKGTMIVMTKKDMKKIGTGIDIETTEIEIDTGRGKGTEIGRVAESGIIEEPRM